VFQLVELINKRCRNAIRQHLVGRPHLLGQASCHGRRAWLPAARRSCPAGWFDHRQCLPHAVMGQHHMRVRQRQPPLFCQPWELFAERLGRARQSTMVLAKRQMLAFDNAGLDRRARWECGPARGKASGVSTHDVMVDRHHTTPFARLHHLGIAPLMVGNAPWMGVRAPRATPWRLRPFAIHRQQGGPVCRPWVAGNKGDQGRGDRRDALPQHIGCRLRALADDKGHDPAPLWGQGPPDPGIAIGVTRGVRPRERLVFRMDNTPQFVHLTLSEGPLLPHIQSYQPTLLGGALEPGTHGILVNLDDPRGRPERMAFRSGANGQFKQRRVMLHIDLRGTVGQGHATPTRATQSLALAPCGPMLDQPALAKAHAVKRTDRMWTLEGFPVHMILGFPSDLGSAEDTVLGDA
jgi:hypothetical protein